MDGLKPTKGGHEIRTRAAAAHRGDLGVIGNSSKFARRPRDISRSVTSSIDGAFVTSFAVLVS